MRAAPRRRRELALRLAELQEKVARACRPPAAPLERGGPHVELAAHPIVTVATAQKLLGKSKQAVNAAINVLADKGVLHPITVAERNRAWEARDLFDLINDVERELATPTDDDEPSRPTPRQTTSSPPRR